MFHSVKDKDNILNHNLWSGGDKTKTSYLNYATSVEVSVSDEWQTNGDLSFKAVTITPNNVNSGYFYTLIDVSSNNTYKLTVDIKNNGETGPVKVYARQGSSSTTQQSLGSVSCPTGEITPVMITGTIPTDYDKVMLMFPCVNGTVYIDNICLKEV